MRPFNITDLQQADLSIEQAKFIFDQAEKQLKQSIDGSNLIVTRTVILLTVSVGIFSSITGFVLQQYSENGYLGQLGITALWTLIYLSVWIVFTIKNIKGTDYKDIGSEPADLLHTHYLEAFPTDHTKRTVYYYNSESKEYQRRIEEAKKINSSRWKRFRISLYGIVILPILTGALFMIINFF